MPKPKSVPKTAEATPSKDVARHSIPTMGERASKSPSSVIERHRRKVKPAPSSVKDAERPIINLPLTTQGKFIDFACVKEIFDKVEEKKQAQQREVSSEIWEHYIDTLWTSKCQPKNPNIQAKAGEKVDATGQFIVSAGSKIKIDMVEPEDEEMPEDALVRSLVNAGVNSSNAERLVSSEVSFVPNWSLNFTDLMRGEVREGKINASSPTQATAAEILFCAINGEDLDGNQISDKERLDLLGGISTDGWIALKEAVDKKTSYVPILADSKDFLDRVCRYADTKDELRGILTVFKPVYYCQRVVFAPSDSAASKTSRMVSEAKSIVTKD
jgi:hypothetical protein